MEIAVLGTGDVGRQLAGRLKEAGHAVWVGSRSASSPEAKAWAEEAGVTLATFDEAAAATRLSMLCVAGAHAVAVVEQAREGLAGKVLLDLSNPLDFSTGFPPRLSVCNDDSLGERIQRAVPDTRVVKGLNTLSNTLMLSPERLKGPHDVLICGEDAEAKDQVRELLGSFGWEHILDLGGIDNARGLEMWLPLWTRLYRALGTPDFNLHIQR